MIPPIIWGNYHDFLIVVTSFFTYIMSLPSSYMYYRRSSQISKDGLFKEKMNVIIMQGYFDITYL